MPPAFPRPPTGTCALTIHGPVSAAGGATSDVRARKPAGMGMPPSASSSFASCSRTIIAKCSLLLPGRPGHVIDDIDDTEMAAAVVVRQPDPALHLAPQNDQLMSENRVLCLKSAL